MRARYRPESVPNPHVSGGCPPSVATVRSAEAQREGVRTRGTPKQQSKPVDYRPGTG